MAQPRLRVPASGLGGSGYRIPTRTSPEGKPVTVPGVTTVLRAIDKPALIDWAVQQVAAYAVTHVDDLLNRTTEQGFGFLRYFHTRAPKEGDPLREAHRNVLNDAAELGTNVHEWVEAYLQNDFLPTLDRPEAVEMAEKFVEWFTAFSFQHDVELIESEATVYNSEAGYAGTIDLLLLVDGEVWLVDVKTSRGTWPEHGMQVAALAEADTMMVEVPAETEGAVQHKVSTKVVAPGASQDSWWVEAPAVAVDRFALLHLRPWDTDNSGNEVPAFCVLKEIRPDVIPVMYKSFLSALDLKLNEKKLKEIGGMFYE